MNAEKQARDDRLLDEMVDNLIDACEFAVISHQSLPPEVFPAVLRQPLWLLAEAIEKVRPGWTEPLIEMGFEGGTSCLTASTRSSAR